MFDKILNLVKILHEMYPFLRYQQLMTIAARKAGWEDSDLFYCPDEVILNGLITAFKEGIQA